MILFNEKKYNALLEEIYGKFPSFQVVGDRALKLGLDNMHTLDASIGHPSQSLKCVHIAGTNGKGSVSSMIASALMECGLKVGLYTSPHLTDFRERIKINGRMISREWVFDFLTEHKELFERTGASFFEITTAMAFAYFAQQQVDIAVIECGLGGRLDSTNIITPLVSVITSIGLDHCQYLGNTLESIAREKAGIIKKGIPVVIGERIAEENSNAALPKNEPNAALPKNEPNAALPKNEPFESIAKDCGSEIYFAETITDSSNKEMSSDAISSDAETSDKIPSGEIPSGEIYAFAKKIVEGVAEEKMDLKGEYQKKNVRTAAAALAVLMQSGSFAQLIEQQNISSNKALKRFVKGIENAAANTHLRGRWEILSKKPLVICDIGHNEHGIKALMPQVVATYEKVALKAQAAGRKRMPEFYMVFGVMKDKNLKAELPLLPQTAHYLWVKASSERALPATELAEIMKNTGFNGEVVIGAETAKATEAEKELKKSTGIYGIGSVKSTIKYILQKAKPQDFIFIGGSSYVVAEAIRFFDENPLEK